MPLRPARYSDLPAISAIFAAGFWDEEVVGYIMHPHRHEYPQDYYENWTRKIREEYWSYSHIFIVSYYMKERVGETSEEGGEAGNGAQGKGQDEVLTGVAAWERRGKGWEKVWGIRTRWDLRNLITPFLQFYHRIISNAYFYPNRAADPAESDLDDRLFPYVAGFWSEPHRSSCWDLSHLSVAPEYQNRGYGRALVRWGLERAEADGVAASVLCADGKDMFYRRCGFEVEVGRATDGLDNPLKGRVRGGAILFRDIKAGRREEGQE